MENVQPIFVYHASDWTTFKFLRFVYHGVTCVISREGLRRTGEAEFVPCTVSVIGNRFRIAWGNETMEIGFLSGNKNAPDFTFPRVSASEARTLFRTFLGLAEDGTVVLPATPTAANLRFV